MSEKSMNMVTFLEFTLPYAQTTMRIEKLKAGKYYEAQKVYSAWLNEIQALLSGAKVDKNDYTDENGIVDTKKLAAIELANGSKQLDIILSKNEDCAKKKMELIAICANIPLEKLQEDFFPEDLETIFEKCSQLNNFLENLKKSVTPTVAIGA